MFHMCETQDLNLGTTKKNKKKKKRKFGRYKYLPLRLSRVFLNMIKSTGNKRKNKQLGPYLT